MPDISIVPVGRVDPDILDFLSMAMPGNIGARVRVVRDARLDPSDAFNSGRQQYHSTKLLLKLLSTDCGTDSKILGVAAVDLFIPILTFVFGEAQLGGRAALVSTYRLRQQYYGLREDKKLFYERCEKEAVHELGHAFGLNHCRSYSCVMHFSNSIEQVDVKGATFCDSCGVSLRNSSQVQSWPR